MRMKGHPAIRC